ncbi:hypothetical protein HPB49_001639 [Dermacentor silvarum]|uniref:Uncharacterized protein n=1 Tax=Dermacentor silvarum TaxID=543639 RepID=A0ACB8C6U7_DERSI|nr:hypothetical protein HPB49_001639 [Dermacentor silvarum]
MWIKDDTTLHRGTALRITDSADYSTLTIQALKTSDAGNYTCVVSNSGGTASHSDVLHVKVSTKISPFTFSKNLLVGERTSVMCATTSGDQPFRFSWLKDGRPLQQSTKINIATSPQFSALTIEKLDLRDAGNYTCSVSNTHGTVSYTDTLEVRAAPKILPFAFPRALTVGETTSVTCTTTAGDEPFKYIWLKDGLVVQPGDNVKVVTSPEFSVFKIDKLTLENAGNYTCVVSNAGGTVSHASTLEIRVPPSIPPFQFPKNLEVQQRISVICTISVGEKPLQFAWLKDGSALASGSGHVRIADNAESSTLHIDVLTLESAGNYTCSVTNKAGYTSYTALLVVHAPKIQPFSFPATLNVGERSGTICIVTAGDKPLTFSWFKDGSALTTNDNIKVTSNAEFSNLNFGSLEGNHTGNYTCSVRNSVGSASFTAFLAVHCKFIVAFPFASSCKTTQIAAIDGKRRPSKRTVNFPFSNSCALFAEKPKLQPLVFPRSRIRVGESASALCALVAGDHDVKFRWFKENVEIGGAVPNVKVKNDKKVSVLTVEPANLQSAGNYTCTAENNYGTDANSATLVVEDAPKIQPFSFNNKVRIGGRAIATCTIMTNAAPVTFTWSKDGARLQETNGMSIQETKLVSLLVIQRTESSSRGNYTCRASNLLGADEHTAELIVEEPPKVNPFSFTKTLSEGQSTAVTCTVTEGSKPVQLQWLKDGHEVVSSGAVKLIKHETIVVLSIEPVQVADSGNYTCVARNKYGYDRYTSALQVNAPPKWDVEPRDVVLKRGERLELHCKAVGHPAPEIRWLKEGTELKRPSENRAQVLQNGTLVISNATSEDSGKFSCLASNGIGAALTKTVTLLVKNGPKIQPFQLPARVKAGNKVSATCNLALGTPPVTFSWHKDGSDVTNLSKDISYGSNIMSVLAIPSASLDSQGNYTCRAANAYGSDAHTVQLKVEMPPVWTVEPGDAFGTIGGMLNLTCLASGSPEPTITWKKFTGQTSLQTWKQPVVSLFPLTEAHRGKYTCDASNDIGGRLTKTISVFVRDAPVIQPLVLPSDVVTGVNTRLLCNVQKGTRPLTFAWIKDGASVRDGVSSQDDFSLLSIDPVTAESAGNYTCVVSNAAGTDRYTSTLEVKQPSQWIEEPRDISSAEGSEVQLRCSAAGRPQPSVTWSRCISGEKRSLVCGDSATPVPVKTSNGSVSFEHVSKKDEGRYACFVDNGVGKPLRKVIRVAVNEPTPAPHTAPAAVVAAAEESGRRAEPERAQGEASNKKGRIALSEFTSSHHMIMLEIFETMTDSGLRSELFISSTERSDGAVYTCRAENEFGHDERTSKLLVVEVPGQPQDVKVSETWSRSASVSWSPPYSGNSPVAKYVIQYWKDSGTAHRLQEVAVPGSQTSALVGDLHPGSTYHLSILAENSVGVGLASTPVKLHTGEEEPSAAPTDFHVEARGPSTARVSWKASPSHPPPPDEWNGDLLGYYIGYKPTSSGQPYSYRTSEFRPNASHEFFLTGLQRGTEYAVIVKAYNAAGSGVASHELHVKTLDGDVPPPPKVFVSGTTHSSITVTWHQQFASGVRGYVLYHRPEESSQDWKEVNLDSRTSSYTVSGLESGVLYQLYVSATNEYGTGDPSEIITVRTHKAGGVMQSPIFGDASTPLYLNLFIMIPVLASLVTIVLVVIVTCVCLQRIKRRPPQPPLQPPPGTMERRSKQFAGGFDGQPQMTSTSARHAEKAQQAAGEYTGLSQRYVEVQPPPLPADHPVRAVPGALRHAAHDRRARGKDGQAQRQPGDEDVPRTEPGATNASHGRQVLHVHQEGPHVRERPVMPRRVNYATDSTVEVETASGALGSSSHSLLSRFTTSATKPQSTHPDPAVPSPRRSRPSYAHYERA